MISDDAKSNIDSWSQGEITDSDFTKELERLAEQKILEIPNSQTGEGEIPSWLKIPAGWWAEGKIGNADFVKGIQYLIDREIIRI